MQIERLYSSHTSLSNVAATGLDVKPLYVVIENSVLKIVDMDVSEIYSDSIVVVPPGLLRVNAQYVLLNQYVSAERPAGGQICTLGRWLPFSRCSVVFPEL
jgi:hypothetical protein